MRNIFLRWLNHYMMYYDNFTENMYFCSVTTILKLHIGRKINSVYKDENVTKNQSKLGQQKMHKKSEKIYLGQICAPQNSIWNVRVRF